MADEAAAPAEQAAETPAEPVRNAEAVLAQNAELLAEIKRLKPIAKKAEGFDFDKAMAAIEAQDKAEQDKLTKRGEWDKLKETLELRHNDALAKAKSDYDGLLSNLKREKLTNTLIEKGALPDRAKYLVSELDGQLELVSDEKGFSLKKIGGVGDSVELDAVFENVKQTSPFFFAASGASGSGASGSQQSAGNGKTMPEAQFDSMSPQEQAAFITSGGKPV